MAFALNFVREGREAEIREIPRSWREVAARKKGAIRIPGEAVDALWPAR